MDLGTLLNQVHQTRIDFRYNKATNSYSIVRLNTDHSKVLYQDGRYRTTTNAEIKRQLAAY